MINVRLLDLDTDEYAQEYCEQISLEEFLSSQMNERKIKLALVKNGHQNAGFKIATNSSEREALARNYRVEFYTTDITDLVFESDVTKNILRENLYKR